MRRLKNIPRLVGRLNVMQCKGDKSKAGENGKKCYCGTHVLINNTHIQ